MNQNNNQKNQETQDNMNKQEESNKNKQNINYKLIKNQSAMDLENLNIFL